MKPPWPPRLSGAGSTWEYYFEGDGTRIRLRNVKLHPNGDLTAVLWSFTPDGRFIPYSGVVNLASAPTRERIARFLESRWPTENWIRHLDALFTELYWRSTEGDPPVELSGAGERRRVAYVVRPVLPADDVSIIYGWSGVGKGWLALILARAVISGQVPPHLPFTVERTGRVIYLDYESSPSDIEYRWQRVCGGADDKLVYRRCVRPLADDLDYLTGLVQEVDPVLLIVDSAGLAAGGDLNSTQSALTLFKALRHLNRTTLLIAHAPKNTDEPTVYGNAYFTNLARSVWELRAEREPGTPELVLALLHRKSNRSTLHPPIAFRLVIGDTEDPVMVYPADVDEVSGAAPTRDIVLDVLKAGPMRIKEIESLTGLGFDRVRSALRRLEAEGLVERTASGAWALKQRPREDFEVPF